MWRVGLGVADVTVFEPGMWMFGWGAPGNVACGVAEPLFARALVVEGEGRRLALVVCDLGFVSQSVRQAVVDRLGSLGLDEHGTLISATHTHSGPNGYSQAMFYAVTAPGFSRRVHDAIVDGIVAALERAVATLAPGRLRVAAGIVPAGERIAFQRAVAAHNRNPEATPLPPGVVAPVDLPMTVLRVEDAAGRPRGLVAWFPLHGTCIHGDNTLLHPDHKGVAARRCEDEGLVALFPQEAAGDVSPNSVWDPARRWLAGPTDDFSWAARVGEVEARHALALLAAAGSAPPLEGRLDAAVRYADLSSQPADPAFTGGIAGVGGATARNGLAFAHGTAEGPGPLYGAQWLDRVLSPMAGLWNARPGAPEWLRRHGPKFPWWDLGHGQKGRVLGMFGTMNPVLARVDEPRVAWYRATLGSGVLGDRPWMPQVLPAQVLAIGALAVAAVPHEPTTVAGRRLAAAVRRPGEQVVVTGYANAYAGYLVTPEEYDLHGYEAANTMFGRWTLPAWCTVLAALRRDLDAGRRELGVPVPRWEGFV